MLSHRILMIYQDNLDFSCILNYNLIDEKYSVSNLVICQERKNKGKQKLEIEE